MKLRLISEDITKREFFDFYSLEYAYSKDKNPEIERNLHFLADHILRDHLNQLADILIERLPNIDDWEVQKVMYKYGLTVDEEYMLVGIDKLTFKEKVSIIYDLVKINSHHDFTGDTWFSLGRTFLDLVRYGSGRKSKILAIDKLYNLLHHGGPIVDYMDESDWLEDALHIRDNANPAQLFALASPRVRALVGRSSYSGMKRGPVGDIAKIYTALRRASKGNPGIVVNQIDDEMLEVDVHFTPLFLKTGTAPWVAIGGKVNPAHQRFVDNGELTLGEPTVGSIYIEDAGNVFIVGNNQSSVAVRKPVNRQYSLAQDMIQAAIYTADGKDVRIGNAVADIKPSYNYRGGRRIV